LQGVASLLVQARCQQPGALIHFKSGMELFTQPKLLIEEVRCLYKRWALPGYDGKAGEECGGGDTRSTGQGHWATECARHNLDDGNGERGVEYPQEGTCRALLVAAAPEGLEAREQCLICCLADELHNLEPPTCG
jgi:hypothetical protein